MKPQLLMMLLLAIPPVLSTLLACENAEKVDAPVPAKVGSTFRETPGPAPLRVTPAPASAAPAAKPAPKSGTGTSTGLKAWFIM